MNEAILNEAVDYTSEMSVPNDRLTSQIIGAGIEVHRKLGPKLLEAIYQRAMEIELHRRGVPFCAQAPVPVIYKGEFVGDFYADLIVAERVVVELKAVLAQQRTPRADALVPAEHAAPSRLDHELQRGHARAGPEARDPLTPR